MEQRPSAKTNAGAPAFGSKAAGFDLSSITLHFAGCASASRWLVPVEAPCTLRGDNTQKVRRSYFARIKKSTRNAANTRKASPARINQACGPALFPDTKTSSWAETKFNSAFL